MSSRFSYYPEQPMAQATLTAFYILCNTHEAASSFLDIFEKTRQGRNARGTPTDKEQDLLRAMVAFAASGLDSMVKQLIRDTLEKVIERSPGAMRNFKQYILRSA
jgi:hypothetical protein